MRKSFDGLSGLVRNELGRDPMDGEVYVFLNRQRSLIKLLVWDRSGWALWSKRLERGSYELPCGEGDGVSLSWSELMHRLSQLERLIFGRKSERFVSGGVMGGQPTLFSELASPLAAPEFEKESITYERKKGKGVEKLHPGRNEF
jgi:hypothetical protein